MATDNKKVDKNRMNSGGNNENINVPVAVPLNELFSIDVEAHLRKAASHTFGSRSHYPVELVRAALSRGARNVEVHFLRHGLEVIDDGQGMDQAALTTLCHLSDPEVATELKEAAVEAVQVPGQYGLLAMFAPSPDKLEVENVHASGKFSLLLTKGKMQKSTSCARRIGTRLFMSIPAGHNRNPEQEKKILKVYCQGVRKSIKLDNEKISGRPLLTGQMASVVMKSCKYFSYGIMGIPPSSDLCRIRLLNNDIPYRYVALPPYKGFVFDAAVEYDYGNNTDITKNFMNHLTAYAGHLYRWLADHHAGTPEQIRERIEELYFSHYRHTKDASLLKDFKIFNLFNSTQRLSLEQVEQLAASPEGTIYTIPQHKEQLNYHTTGRKVLSLTREQADFLVNRRKLPVTFISPLGRKGKKLNERIYLLRKWIKELFLKLAPKPSPAQTVSQQHMTMGEQLLVDCIKELLKSDKLAGISTINCREVQLTDSSGPFPVAWDNEAGIAFIRRKHRLVRKAVTAVQQDRANGELFLPLLAGK